MDEAAAMTPDSPLLRVSLATLLHLHRGVAAGMIAAPLVDLELRRRGLEVAVVTILVESLGELSQGPLLAVLGALLGERERAERELSRLLWTGPSARRSGARRWLFRVHARQGGGDRCLGGDRRQRQFHRGRIRRNIEAGVLLRSAGFVHALLQQWRGLIADGILREVG